MKKYILSLAAIAVLFSSTANAQTEADGMKAMNYENYASAKNIYRTILNANPTDAKAYFNFAEALFKNEQFDSAKIIYQNGIVNNQRLAWNFVGLGKCFLVEGNKEEATKNFKKALDLVSTKDMVTASLVGEAYTADEKNGMADDAITFLNEKININDKSASIYEALGNAYLFKNDGGNAVTNYEAALQNDPNRVSALVKIGQIYIRAKNYDLALSYFNKALAIDANYPPAHREMSDLYFMAAKYDKAKAEFDEYLKYADQNIETKIRTIKILYKSERYDDAIKAINEVLPQQQSNFVLHRLLGYSLVKQEKMTDAENAFMQYFKTVPTDKILPSDYTNYVKALTKNGKDSIAIITMKKAMAIDKDADFVNDILAIYFKQKKYDNVINEFEINMNKGFKANVNTYFFAARSYYYKENWLMADSANKKITQLAPTSPSGWLGRAQCTVRLETESTQGLAKPYYEKYLETVKLDDAKNKGNIIQSYKYLAANAYLQLKDNIAAKGYYEKILVLDPEDAQAKEVMQSLGK